jgi:hypothetical protein
MPCLRGYCRSYLRPMLRAFCASAISPLIVDFLERRGTAACGLARGKTGLFIGAAYPSSGFPQLICRRRQSSLLAETKSNSLYASRARNRGAAKSSNIRTRSGINP